MSISTPQGGGARRQPARKAVAGGKPNMSKDTVNGAEAPAKAAPAKAASTAAKSTATKASAASKSTASAAARSGAAAARASAAKAAPAKKAPARPVTKGGGRRPITPVKVSQGRNWGPIALFSVVVLIAVGIIGFAGWKVYETGLTVSDRVERIDGVVNWRTKDKNLVKAAQHQAGKIEYAQKPPVAGKHNNDWQNCMGDIYDAPIANEHAVHSLEHGAVWVTYDPAKVSKEQIESLGAKVRGKDFSMMSPVEGLPKAVSLQAWGFQLQVDDPADKRVDEFIKVTRKNAAVEPGVSCASGITETGTTPRDLPQQQQQPGG